MSTFFALLALLAPIAAIIFVPKWMKKKGKGRNSLVRILTGVGCAVVLLIIFAALSNAFNSDEEQSATTTQTEAVEDNQPEKVKYPMFPKYTQFAYYKRDPKGDFNYRIFVYITDASPKDMEKHAKKQQWSSHGTTMVCYFRSSEGLNSNAITLAKNVDGAISEIWKPSLVARYIHWPTGKEQFEENPYIEDDYTLTTTKQSTATQKTSTRCAAITEEGTRCSRNADENSIYCWQHK